MRTMKKKIICTLVILCFLSFSWLVAQTKLPEDKVISTLKGFYAEYITLFDIPLAAFSDLSRTEVLHRRIIEERYITQQLLTHLDSLRLNLDLMHDPFIQAQDYWIGWLETMRIQKDTDGENRYSVFLWRSNEGRYIRIRMVMAEKDGAIKINELLNKFELEFVDADYFDTPASALSRSNYDWLWSTSHLLTHNLRLSYRTPEGFEVKEGTECFYLPNRMLRVVFDCLINQFHSEDNEVIAFLRVFPPPVAEDFVTESHKNNVMRFTYNRFHKYLQHIQRLVNSSVWQGDRDDFQLDWRESAHFFSPEEARSQFNADMAAFFTLTLPPQYYYLGKYRYIDVFLLQKDGRGFVQFISFYTKDAKQNIDCYRRRLWGALRYKN